MQRVMKLCTILLEHGANVNQQTTTGVTALFAAAESGRLELCRLLIVRSPADFCSCSQNSGADVNLERHDGATALLVSASNCHSEVGELLLRHDARPDKSLKASGVVPLQVAAERVLQSFVAS